jgi:hypothetical protein
VLEAVHAYLVPGRRDLGREAGRPGNHAAQHEEGGMNLALGQHPGKSRSGVGIRTVVEGKGHMTRISLASQPLEREHPDWSQAGEAGPGVRDGEPSGRAACQKGSLPPNTRVNST